MADATIKGVLQVKKGNDYVTMYPATTAEQVKGLAETARQKVAPLLKTKEEFENENPVVANGIHAIETDTGRYKIGDGASTYSELEYIPVSVFGATDLKELKLTTENITDFQSKMKENIQIIRGSRTEFGTLTESTVKNALYVDEVGGVKIGDGENKWSDLKFLNSGSQITLQKKNPDGSYTPV